MVGLVVTGVVGLIVSIIMVVVGVFVVVVVVVRVWLLLVCWVELLVFLLALIGHTTTTTIDGVTTTYGVFLCRCVSVVAIVVVADRWV